jgi:hypothetical protein
MEDVDFKLIGRESTLFLQDLKQLESSLCKEVSRSRILVVGGGGTIGSSVTTELYKRNAQTLHVVDLNENSLVELVRDLRCSDIKFTGDFKIFCLDAGSDEFKELLNYEQTYDFVFNLSALKHVRSEGDAFTLMRMLKVNVVNNVILKKYATANKIKKLFCVSTDKAADPVNLMGASKRIMEIYLKDKLDDCNISMARFANVAFSNGSLLDSFKNRINKFQPLVAPYDIGRYFMTKEEAGIMCLLATFFGEKNDTFIPRISSNLSLKSFDKIAIDYLRSMQFSPHFCSSEHEARAFPKDRIIKEGIWPCYFHRSKTTGEKSEEVFFNNSDKVNWERFLDVGVLNTEEKIASDQIHKFLNEIETTLKIGDWSKKDLIRLVQTVLPKFEHVELNKNLSEGM